jgi:large-conductance mechanosensitive channel
MPFTKCPKCRKVQQVVPALITKAVGCMDARCSISFKAQEYRLHSGFMSRLVFWFVIAFALFMLVRVIWTNAGQIVQLIG